MDMDHVITIRDVVSASGAVLAVIAALIIGFFLIWLTSQIFR